MSSEIQVSSITLLLTQWPEDLECCVVTLLANIALSRPPPRSEFWTHGRFDLELPDGKDVLVAVQVDVRKPLNLITSPINPNITYPGSIVCY